MPTFFQRPKAVSLPGSHGVSTSTAQAAAAAPNAKALGGTWALGMASNSAKAAPSTGGIHAGTADRHVRGGQFMAAGHEKVG